MALVRPVGGVGKKAMTYDVPAEKQPEMRRVQQTLREKGGDFERLADEMEHLWDNPGEFEDGLLAEETDWEDDHVMLVFHLGVCFGTDYEHAYPRGESDE